MRLVRTARELRDADGLGGVVVPTMGALHAGHAALIEHAARVAAGRAPVVVTIFVNPTQFNDPRDYARYPRTLDDDAALAARAGAAVLFVPDPDAVYPPDAPVPVPTLPPVATEPGLEDLYRPGHFAGVCQVVARLFDLLSPSRAVFGEKDWQQLQVVRALAEARADRIEIIGVETVREPDGLAMSSRNRFLTADDRVRALAIPGALAACGRMHPAPPSELERVMRAVLDSAGLRVEYAVVREARTLRPLDGAGEQGLGEGAGACRALIAAWAGSVRLIDNAAIGPGSADPDQA